MRSPSVRSRLIRASHGRTLTRTPWRNLPPPFARSACSSRSWSERSCRAGSNWSWESAGGVPASAGLEHVPAIVRGTPNDELLREALMENLHREQLNPLEEAAAYQQLLDDFSATHDELARKVGRSRPHISNTIRLLQLPPQVQRRVAAGVLSAGHARALLALADPEEQDRLAHRIVAEGLSVRAVEEIVALGQHQAKPRRTSAKQPIAPPSPTWRTASPTPWTPGSRWKSENKRARSWWSSPP